ncbi:MAG: purine-binding chemotaxis protein CheW [Lachnospiraceae bacterium]|nr:purine-binding chemotaxis protein CheW [Lachnospiraceae bacterium]
MDENNVILDTKQYIVVKLDGEQYGIDISYVDNIVRMQKPTRVPKTQHYFKGVINLRGEIIPVMSLRLKFGLCDTEETNATRIIIIKTEANAKLGIVVDEVREVVTLSENDVEKTSFDAGKEDQSSLIGVGKVTDSLISLLNIQSLLNDIDND